MTETLQRPARPSPPLRAAGASTVVGGVRAAVVAAGLGLLLVLAPVLVLWLADDRAGTGVLDVLRTAAQLWLVAHGASLEVPAGTYGLTPLGLLLLPGWLLGRAGRACAQAGQGPGGLSRHAVAVAVPYGVVAGVAGLLGATDAVAPTPVSSVLSPALLAALAVLVGGRGCLPAAPVGLLRLARPVLGATAVLVAAGALLVGAALALHLPRASELAGASEPGAVGGLGLLLAGLALVPNAVVWGVSWLAGPGFTLGAATAVGPFGHELGPVPAFPLLAALPDAAPPGWVGVLVLAVPVGAGLLAGRLVDRSLPDPSAARSAGLATLVGTVTGVVWTVLAWASGGPVGGERLAELGPPPWAVGLALALSVGAGAVLSASFLRYRARP